MVSAAKKKLVESRHAYTKTQDKALAQAEASSKAAEPIPREYLKMAANDPLHLAAMQGDTSGIKRLLDDGYDVNRLDAENRTPLMLAALFGQTENVSCLLNCGASAIKKDIFGQKPLHYAQDCRCNVDKRNVTYGWITCGWDILDSSQISQERRIIVALLKGNQKPHVCPSRPNSFSDYYAVKPGKSTFTVMAPVFTITVNNAENRTIAWTLNKGTLDTRACAVSGWSFTKYKNPPSFLLDSEAWTDKVVMLSNLVGHDLHGGNYDFEEHGRMFSSHAEKQIIAFIAWERVLEAMSSASPRSWKRSRQAKIEDEVEIFVSRIPCRWCEDMCTKTNVFLGTNMKLVFIHRIHNLADRCKCGGCVCELPVPKVVIPVIHDVEGISLGMGNSGTGVPSGLSRPPNQPLVPSRSQPKRNTSKEVRRNEETSGLSTPVPIIKTLQEKFQKSLNKSAAVVSKTRQEISTASSESSEAEEEWGPIDPPPTPVRFPSLSQTATKSSFSDRGKNSISPAFSFPSPAFPVNEHVDLDSDDDSDATKWEAECPTSAKRKSFGMFEKHFSKRQCLESQKTPLTNSGSRQIFPDSPASSISLMKYRYKQKKTTTSMSDCSAKRSTTLIKRIPAKKSPVKTASIKPRLVRTASVSLIGSPKINSIKKSKLGGQPQRKSNTSID